MGGLIEHEKTRCQTLGCEPSMGRAEEHSQAEGETHLSKTLMNEVLIVGIKWFVLVVTVFGQR